MLFDDNELPKKTFEELYAEGKITALQYRSVLFMMKTGPSFTSSPTDEFVDIDKKIEELTRIIEAQRKGS